MTPEREQQLCLELDVFVAEFREMVSLPKTPENDARFQEAYNQLESWLRDHEEELTGGGDA